MHSINYNYAPPTFQHQWQKNTARNLNNALTLIKVACQPLRKKGLVVFKTPASRGRGGGTRIFTTKVLDFESSVKVKF